MDLTPYIVGKHYWIPTVTMLKYGRTRAWPVIGPQHEDADVIGFEPDHYHFDYRFLTDSDLDLLHRVGFRQYPKEIVASSLVLSHENEDLPPLPDVVMKRRKCRRVNGPYPVDKVRWLPKLEAKYANHKIDDRLICPHRRAPLAGLTPDAAGCVTCPLHGLRWDCSTGELSPLK